MQQELDNVIKKPENSEILNSPKLISMGGLPGLTSHIIKETGSQISKESKSGAFEGDAPTFNFGGIVGKDLNTGISIKGAGRDDTLIRANIGDAVLTEKDQKDLSKSLLTGISLPGSNKSVSGSGKNAQGSTAIAVRRGEAIITSEEQQNLFENFGLNVPGWLSGRKPQSVNAEKIEAKSGVSGFFGGGIIEGYAKGGMVGGMSLLNLGKKNSGNSDHPESVNYENEFSPTSANKLNPFVNIVSKAISAVENIFSPSIDSVPSTSETNKRLATDSRGWVGKQGGGIITGAKKIASGALNQFFNVISQPAAASTGKRSSLEQVQLAGSLIPISPISEPGDISIRQRGMREYAEQKFTSGKGVKGLQGGGSVDHNPHSKYLSSDYFYKNKNNPQTEQAEEDFPTWVKILRENISNSLKSNENVNSNKSTKNDKVKDLGEKAKDDKVENKRNRDPLSNTLKDIRKMRANSLERQGRLNEAYGLRSFGTGVDFSSLFSKGLVMENSGVDISGGTADRQLTALQPGEYVIPKNSVDKLGKMFFDNMVASTDSNSSPAKEGLGKNIFSKPMDLGLKFPSLETNYNLNNLKNNSSLAFDTNFNLNAKKKPSIDNTLKELREMRSRSLDRQGKTLDALSVRSLNNNFSKINPNKSFIEPSKTYDTKLNNIVEGKSLNYTPEKMEGNKDLDTFKFSLDKNFSVRLKDLGEQVKTTFSPVTNLFADKKEEEKKNIEKPMSWNINDKMPRIVQNPTTTIFNVPQKKDASESQIKPTESLISSSIKKSLIEKQVDKIRSMRARSLERQGRTSESYGLNAFNTGKDMSSFFSKGLVMENTGIDIPGGSADRQLTALQPGEYVIPKLTVDVLGKGFFDTVVGATDSNSTAAKIGFKPNNIGEKIKPYNMSSSSASPQVIKMPTIEQTQSQNNQSGQMVNNSEVFFSARCPNKSSINERQRILDTLGFVSNI